MERIAKKDLEHMERIDDEMMKRVLYESQSMNFQDFTPWDVESALGTSSLSHEDFAALLSPAAFPYLEAMAQKAKRLTQAQFGNAVALYTPLYIANYCVNECVYCGFNCKNNIHRGKLTMAEIETEFQAIAKTGLREILILTGESRHQSSLEYIGEAVSLSKQYFSTIGIEIYPRNTDEYAFLQKKGSGFLSVCIKKPITRKHMIRFISADQNVIFPIGFLLKERALRGGMRGVGVGALLGLDNFRRDAFAAGLHAKFLQQKYPHGEISFSVPRLRPYINRADNNSNDVHEPQLLQVMLAYRLFLPFAGINISTRERAGFRDNVVGMVATKISAGVKTGRRRPRRRGKRRRAI